MYRQFFRIGLFRRLFRCVLRGFVTPAVASYGVLRNGLLYVWRRRGKIISVVKSLLELVKMLVEIIKNIQSLLFCDQTVHFVQVAG